MKISVIGIGVMGEPIANPLLLIATFEAIPEATHFARESGLDVSPFLDMALAGPLVSIAGANRDLFGQATQRGHGNDDAIGIVKVLRDKAAS
jgi:3-hydroxyisobutyrate dehydrogenase